MKKIESKEIQELRESIESHLADRNIDTDIVLRCDNPDEWSMTLKVSKKGCSAERIEKAITELFKKINVDDDRTVYFEDIKSPNYCEWYFTHPETPKEILRKQDKEIEEEERQEDRENIRKYEEHRKMLREQGLIIKPRNVKSKSIDLFYVMSKENFDEIENGTKTVEYRTYNPYHIDKCLGRGKDGVKTLVFQLGYGGPGHSIPRKLKYECDGIFLCDDTMEEFPAFKKDGSLVEERDLPDGFIPMLLAIHIGKKIG